ncbi:hypothetical protein E2562_037286 [Oryza meyeriana var. granulata]|uniref:Uncharacterized protein n=1 Tax=Oryza meyeriana var. granulata TaxID=110450 RepID=A0A6G1EA40_9ORYZ|nr:hypothetical protein E2562_037286 [Oryza meyeriana var. granulata]
MPLTPPWPPLSAAPTGRQPLARRRLPLRASSQAAAPPPARLPPLVGPTRLPPASIWDREPSSSLLVGYFASYLYN